MPPQEKRCHLALHGLSFACYGSYRMGISVHPLRTTPWHMALIHEGSLHCGRKLCLLLENVQSEMSAGPSVRVIASAENTTGCKNKNKCTFRDAPHFHWFQYRQSLYKDSHYCDPY
ncbi:hypothetical protein IscW_ISCW020470 [Ixodes scapularis]|uniref:Uncharacterized protein n=1 Tax=Ixodes scapularis TaxID=6945 RepID=B7Q2E4_IXOSC|nr:hypothetical protein IscW_ISCW020470 [Ixodes scapularis]|eukprot:XP_002410740.1 hypothetical protein IscW_ISCW020470 [Ixodes scapularis]